MDARALTASVVVCTLRPDLTLQNCIDSLTRQDMSAGDFEIVVVVNTSHADLATIEQLTTPGPAVRVFHEPRPGVSCARNRGASEAMGAVVVFIDDDATAPPDWLRHLVAPFQTKPAIGATGGPITLDLPTALPWWYDPSLDGFWSAFSPSPELVDTGKDATGDETALIPIREFGDLPYGANLAVRKSTWDALGGFDTNLGRRGRSFGGGEDIDLALRVLAHGLEVCVIPAAGVVHHIPPQRITLRHVWATAAQAGLTLGRLGQTRPATSLRRAAVNLLKSLCPLARIPAGRRLNYLLQARLHLTAALTRPRRR